MAPKEAPDPADRGIHRGFLEAVDRDGPAGVVEDLVDDVRGTLRVKDVLNHQGEVA